MAEGFNRVFINRKYNSNDRISGYDENGPVYFRDPPEYCAHKSCRNCRRDGKQGHCEYELNEREDRFCGDCIKKVC